jgi:hypothetical protein
MRMCRRSCGVIGWTLERFTAPVNQPFLVFGRGPLDRDPHPQCVLAVEDQGFAMAGTAPVSIVGVLHRINCAGFGTIAVTVIAGPLNYMGVNPKIDDCNVPQPSP